MQPVHTAVQRHAYTMEGAHNCAASCIHHGGGGGGGTRLCSLMHTPWMGGGGGGRTAVQHGIHHVCVCGGGGGGEVYMGLLFGKAQDQYHNGIVCAVTNRLFVHVSVW